MKRHLCLLLGLLLLVPSLLVLTAQRKASPPLERLGVKPSFEATFFSSLEYRCLISQLLFYDASFYFGSMLEREHEKPDYPMVLKYVDSATRLNPYNIDAHYFGQAVLTWDAGMVREMNHIMERGIKRRDWDFYLPFFVGFNYAFFLRDQASAAKYFEKAARLNPKMTFLPTYVARLYYESNKTEQALQYLKVVYEGTFNDVVRRSILTRITALESILLLEKAAQKYRETTGREPQQLDDLVTGGILKRIPPDPYGGTFYYDRNDKRIKTSSKLASPGAQP